MGDLGRTLLLAGLAIAGLGALVVFAPGLRLGRLPGDVRIEKDGFTLYFPVTTMIIFSIVLTVCMYALRKIGR